MLETGKNGLIFKKTYEIAYALWRIAANIVEKHFADKLFEVSVDLIYSMGDKDQEAIISKIAGIEALISFGLNINCIGSSNAEILIREIGNLKSAINSEIGKIGDIDIADIFYADDPSEDISENLEEIKIDNLNIHESGTGKPEIRQSAIVERIRQIGNCRLSDLQVVLPDSSERTIRYDLESLVQRNLIERVGTGGRSVYYRIRN